tara:strand:+ start:275 stop:715 length:441 start_codon:yes stop_codon:yes gene_type:complete
MSDDFFSWSCCGFKDDYPKSLFPIVLSFGIAFFVTSIYFSFYEAFFWGCIMIFSWINYFIKFDYQINSKHVRINFFNNSVKKNLNKFKSAHFHLKGVYLSPTAKKSFYGGLKGSWIYLPSDVKKRKKIIDIVSKKIQIVKSHDHIN